MYARPLPPITAELFPPIRTWKGEKNVAVPPPELARPAVGGRVLEGARRRHRRDREGAVVAGDADAGDRDDVTHRPAVRRRGADRYRRCRTSVAPGTASVTVPPPEVARPAVGFMYWKDREVGTAVTVHVPL